MSSTSWKNKEKIRIFNTTIDNISFRDAQGILEEMLNTQGLKKVFTPNTEIVMACKEDTDLAAAINSADLVTSDGIGLVIGAKMQGVEIIERVTGYDLSVYMLALAKKTGKKIFFLGAEPGVAEKAKERVEKDYGEIVADVHHGYFKGSHRGFIDHEEERTVIDAINASGAEILFVGLGFPKQEEFILNNENRLKQIKIAIGNGGVLDVLAGKAKRAPGIFIKLHLEWFYRLLKNPARIKRQMVIPKFLLEIKRNRGAVSIISSRQGGDDEK